MELLLRLWRLLLLVRHPLLRLRLLLLLPLMRHRGRAAAPIEGTVHGLMLLPLLLPLLLHWGGFPSPLNDDVLRQLLLLLLLLLPHTPLHRCRRNRGSYPVLSSRPIDLLPQAKPHFQTVHHNLELLTW